MAELVVLVLDDPGKIEAVLNVWLSLGISGATILDSSGLNYQLSNHNLRDDVPLFPSLSNLLRGREEQHRTLFVVVPDGFDILALVAETEKIVGSLEAPDTGILFTMPVSRVWGLNRRQ